VEEKKLLYGGKRKNLKYGGLEEKFGNHTVE